MMDQNIQQLTVENGVEPVAEEGNGGEKSILLYVESKSCAHEGWQLHQKHVPAEVVQGVSQH